MNTYDYPLGADNSDAPWNEQTKLTPVDVTVSFTMSKNITFFYLIGSQMHVMMLHRVKMH